MPEELSNDEASFMAAWERGSPMRTFIYYVQRATCGALAYLVLHQFVLGLRLVEMSGAFVDACEAGLRIAGLPGTWLVGFFHETRPLNMPPPLATFFLNIVFYFAGIWLLCFIYNRLTRKTYLGPRQDPFQLQPR